MAAEAATRAERFGLVDGRSVDPRERPAAKSASRLPPDRGAPLAKKRRKGIDRAQVKGKMSHLTARPLTYRNPNRATPVAQ